MTPTRAEQVADALLWEGYLLYPYRASALKNRRRWQFGIVPPRMGRSGENEWFTRTECLVEAGADPVLGLAVRHLHLSRRTLERSDGPRGWTPAGELALDGRRLVPWDEAVPCTWDVRGVHLRAMRGEEVHVVEVPEAAHAEPIVGRDGTTAGRWVRRRRALTVAVVVSCEAYGKLLKLTVRVENRTALGAGDEHRPDTLPWSLISAHTLLTMEDGAFVSPLETPPDLPEPAVCRSHATWPGLIGEPPARTTLLSSPIILGDYPAVAPESPADLYDATEIDEILTLRVLTLTDEERRDALATDPRAHAVVKSAEEWSAERQARLHGAARPGRNAATVAGGADALETWLNPPSPTQEVRTQDGRPLTVGSAVRLLPGGGADAMDMFLRGRAAKVAGLHRDLEDRPYVAVTVDDADAADLHAQEGRFLYFGPDELELIDGQDSAPTPGSPSAARVLVAGIGNIFFGDDGFGSAVVDRLARHTLPERVDVEDFGIRGVHLAHHLLDGRYDAVILVDAVARGEAPGTLFVIEPERGREGDTPPESADAHAMTPETVLAYVRRLGGTPPRLLVIGCEPATVEPQMGLSDRVAAALDGAVEMVHAAVGRLRD